VIISDILRHKGSTVVTTAPAERVSAVLAKLAENNVGALVVADGEQVIGIVSERDIVRKLHERGPDLLQATVDQIMTAPVLTATSTDSVDGVAGQMTERRIRHMPIVDDGALVGVVSIGDVVSSRIRQLEEDRGHLEQYITG
jgi:CBS domain-containing protein